jgi:membrane protein
MKSRRKALAKKASQSTLIDAARGVWRFAVERMRETQLQEVASSMTLTTLLSLVPLIAVSVSVFALFPGFAEERQEIENMVFQSLLPEQYTETIIGYIKSFSKHASGLGIFGLAGLAVTALMLIDKFVVTLNRIFMVRKLRPWSQRALLYWALITLGPVFIAFSLTVSTKAVAAASEGISPGVTGVLMGVLQFLLQVAAYTFLFKFVPNCRVPLRDAAIGGAFVAVVGFIVREGFQYYVSAGTLGTIYGAFVAIPVLMLWFYVTWILIFAGAALTATLPLLTSGRYRDSYKKGNDFLTGVAMLRALWEAREAGEPKVSLDRLCDAVDTYPQAAMRVLDALALKGYCAEVLGRKSGSDQVWALLCDPAKTDLRGAADALLIDGSNALLTAPKGRADPDAPEGMLKGWHDVLLESDALDTPLSELFARIGAEDAAAAKKPAA